MYHWKEKRIQEGWKGKINQVRNRLNYYPGHSTQSASRLLMGMGGWLGPFILEMACELSILRPG